MSHLQAVRDKAKETISAAIVKTFRAYGSEPDLNSYVNNKTPISFKCRCGNESETQWTLIQRGTKLPLCLSCRSLETQALFRAHSEEYFLSKVAPLFKANDVELITTVASFQGYMANLKFRCSSCSQAISKSFSNLERFIRKQGVTPHTFKCPSCLSRDLRGPSHGNYRTDLSEEERLVGRNFDWYRHWQDAVREHAGWKCVISGSTKVCAHHLYSWAAYPSLRIFLANGVCLDETLHRDFHRSKTRGGYGRVTTYADFADFYHRLTGRQFDGTDLGYLNNP